HTYVFARELKTLSPSKKGRQANCESEFKARTVPDRNPRRTNPEASTRNSTADFRRLPRPNLACYGAAGERIHVHGRPGTVTRRSRDLPIHQAQVSPAEWKGTRRFPGDFLQP